MLIKYLINIYISLPQGFQIIYNGYRGVSITLEREKEKNVLKKADFVMIYIKNGVTKCTNYR